MTVRKLRFFSLVFSTLMTLLITLGGDSVWAQATPGKVTGTAATAPPASTGNSVGSTSVVDNRRIRRFLGLVVGVSHDEELRIPARELQLAGRTELIQLDRIQNTDIFRIIPQKAGNGIVSIKDKQTGQTYVEMRLDVRDDSLEKVMREVQGMLADIEGIEYKIVNGIIYIDGYVLIPRDLLRINQVISIWPDKVRSLATLSPIARKKIVEFISNDVNNPEVKISAVGDYIKLEGQVASKDEEKRIINLVALYLPELVTEKAPDNSFVNITGRRTGRLEDLIINLMTIKPLDEKVEPVPKMIQVVVHFVKFAENYGKSFNFSFAPVISAQAGAGQQGPTTTVGETAQLINNLLPKLNWAKFHGYAKVLDTASILVQDRKEGSIQRTITNTSLVAGANGALQVNPLPPADVSVKVTPTVRSERSGLIELPLNVSVNSVGKSDATRTLVNTIISVRDRQSAAFGGVIKKDTDTKYGSPATSDAIITLQASKDYNRNNSQFVVFVTPIIKSSASAGVEQVKKKFRLRD